MNKKGAISLSIAACLAFACPQFAHARSTTNSQTANGAMMQSVARREARVMTPANANLEKVLQADKIQQGYQFKATLDGSVHLKNGPDLPRGAVLVGKVTTDQMKPGGPSTLALRFTQADLKDGKTIPIKATIVGITGPEYNTGFNVANETSSWSSKTLRVDQIGVLSGVDLHSNIGSRNSGVLVAQKKDNVKLDAGSQYLAGHRRRPSSDGPQHGKSKEPRRVIGENPQPRSRLHAEKWPALAGHLRCSAEKLEPRRETAAICSAFRPARSLLHPSR